MLKKNYITLSIGFFCTAFIILMYLFLGNLAAVTGDSSVAEAASRWVVSPILFVSFIVGVIFMVLHIKGKQDSNRTQSAQTRQNYYNNSNGSQKPNFNDNKNHNQEFMDDLTRQQHQQFIEEDNRQHQQFMDDINMQQQQEFQQWSLNESMHSVDENLPQGFF